ncbi:conserved hypothetical protein [Acidimicrobium ferrooxidans DSM 10331]|uniref:Uncharacterized protein n=1 Tax=Acidimicrobium ferrooxidans (strain DSM 10331 / JCM 15462 / NBRC 103882 / ICP) TaxID=525909 RepID=C7M2M4_ACIFD|nr:ArdC-like ssDNA-binding domain-containing protein [Acidimicrobium ferrooxidans]ACU53268.1 conserved hypothetical protein [Acidimicrobium ferrooxidans DSM 10331]
MPAALDRSRLLEELTDGVLALTQSEPWRRYLDVQRRFHRYSPQNVLLIDRQRPSATLVAGFRQWQRLGRSVRRGEHGIWIVAPMRVRRTTSDDLDEEVLAGFRWVCVFDVAQTEGAALPEVATRLVGEDPAGVLAKLGGVAHALGFAVEDHRFEGATNGDCSHEQRRIRLSSEVSPRQRVKTLAHELAHALMHERLESRPQAELEAESVAYIVCRALGIDASNFSFGYVASWAGGGAAAVRGIKASCVRIQRASAQILELAGFGVPSGAGS